MCVCVCVCVRRGGAGACRCGAGVAGGEVTRAWRVLGGVGVAGTRNAAVTTRDRAGATRYRYLGDECDAAVTCLPRRGCTRPPHHTRHGPTGAALTTTAVTDLLQVTGGTVTHISYSDSNVV